MSATEATAAPQAQDAPVHAWLHEGGLRVAADAGLGLVLLAAGALAILATGEIASATGAPLAPATFPRILGWLLVTFGIVLLLRAFVLRHEADVYWSPLAVLVIGASVLAGGLAWRHLGMQWALLLGPAEFTAIILVEFAIAIALVRASRMRGLGMLLLGLLIATVGADLATGISRMTFGLPALAEGVGRETVLIGLVVADGALLALAPSLLLASYWRKASRRLSGDVPLVLSLLLRVVGAIAVAGALYLAWLIDGADWPMIAIAAFAAFGMVCQLLGWNRLMLLFGLSLAPLLEENIRRALLISRGDLTLAMGRPIVTALLALTLALLFGALLLSAWRAFGRRRV